MPNSLARSWSTRRTTISICCAKADRRSATALASAAKVSAGAAMPLSAVSPNGRIGCRRRKCGCVSRNCRSACSAARKIRSARARFISTKATRTRSTASTALRSRGRSARTCRRAVSGCLNEEIADLYLRTPVGTRVVVVGNAANLPVVQPQQQNQNQQGPQQQEQQFQQQQLAAAAISAATQQHNQQQQYRNQQQFPSQLR